MKAKAISVHATVKIDERGFVGHAEAFYGRKVIRKKRSAFVHRMFLDAQNDAVDMARVMAEKVYAEYRVGNLI